MDQSTSSSSSTSNHRHHHGNGTRVVSHSEQDFARYDLNLNLNLNLNEDNDDEDKVLMAFVQAGSNKEDDLDAFMDAQMNMDDWSEDEREEEAPVELFQMEEGAGQQREVIGAINPPIAIPAAPYSTMQPVDYDDDMMDWAATACGGGASTNHSVSTASSFERYTETLLPFDIICTARGIYHFQATPNHPGNVTLQRMVQSNLVQYGLATKESERDAVVSSILSQVSSVLWNHGTTNGTTSRIIQEQARFVLVGPPLHNTTTISCRPATAQETKEEIEHALRQHFAIIPTSNCVIFGRGAPARDHPGSRALRAFIEPRRAEYRQSTNKKELERLAKDYISNSRGRFLLPFNKSRPADGCIEADEESIAKKISHLYRHRPRGEGANRTNTDEHQQGIPMVHAQPTNSHHAPIVNHFTATLVPKSSLSSSSSSMTTTSLSDTKGEMSGNKPIPGLVVSVVPGQSSVISTIDIEANHSQNTNNAAAASETSNLSSRATKFVANRNKRTVLVCIFILAIAAIVGIIVATTGGDGSVESPRMWYDDANESTLGQILNRGYLRCGIPNQEGYGMKDPVTGVFVGFEVDLCRAVAAGIFGRESFGNRATEPVQYVNLEVSDRFVALDGEEIDLLLAITTQNMQRNVYEPSTLKGYTFSTPYLVNGLIFAGLPEYLECLEGPLDANVTAATSCEEAKICVLDGTTHKDIVLQKLPELAIGSVVTPSTLELFYDHFINGDVCNILAGEQFDLSEEILRKKRYSGPYQVGSQVLSKELISMVTRDDDPEWSDFVNWILQALMSAEELRIFSGSSNDVSPSELETTLAFGKRFEFMFQDAFFVVGDYGQIYAKHLESLVPRSDANQINLGGETPGMYAIQLGTLETNQPPRTTKSPKLKEIKERRFLNCGVTQTPIFAELDPEKNEWVGLDVDFCKAISAAIFDGTIDVKYEVLSPGERFKALQDGRVDVLARVTTITLERDRMGVSFSYSNFRDEIRFAGTPRFRQCAENLDWNSGDCSDLRVCVTEKTTQFDLLTDIFPASRLHVTNSSSETVESFGNGKCNALAGGSVETSQASIQKWYSGPYDIGKSFSRESLALVTLEEDPLWSKFVNWIVVATLYAEEQGIGRATYLKMPRVDLFRPLVGDEMLRNAIRAVGSYAEIWDRNAGSNGLIREGRNLLNTYPLGPLLISDQNWDMPAVRGDPNNN